MFASAVSPSEWVGTVRLKRRVRYPFPFIGPASHRSNPGERQTRDPPMTERRRRLSHTVSAPHGIVPVHRLLCARIEHRNHLHPRSTTPPAPLRPPPPITAPARLRASARRPLKISRAPLSRSSLSVFLRLSVRLTTCLPVFRASVFLSRRLPVYTFIYSPSVCLAICLSACLPVFCLSS